MRGLLLALFIFVLFAAYSNTFTSPPYLDDFHSFIYEKSMYLDELSFSSALSLAQSRFGLTRFIPVLTFALNHKLGESNLIYFHLVNILIHAFSFLAVYFLTLQIISAARKSKPSTIPDSVAGWLPLGVAALWALSPVQTSAVTYLVQRMASLMGLFYFLAVGFYVKARMCSKESPRKAASYYVGFALAAIAAFLSKENSALLPLSVVLVEIWFFDSEMLRQGWLFFRRNRKTGIAVCVAGVVCLSFALSFIYSHIVHGYYTRYFTMAEHVMTEWRVVIWYISILFWPDPARLSMEHYVDLSTSLINPPTTLLSLLIIVGLIIGSIYFRKKYTTITFGILWFFLNISLESTILPLELVFEHRLYVPSFGIFLSAAIILALMLPHVFRKLSESDYRKVFWSLVVIMASTSALLTFVRNDDWQSIISIQYDNVIKAPQLARTNSNYANALISIHRPGEALKYAERSMELNKPGLETYAVGSNAIVVSLIQMGRFEEAAKRGENLIANQPEKIDVDSLPYLYLNVAHALMALNRDKEAYVHVIEAFKVIEKSDRGIRKKDAASLVMRTLLDRVREKNIDLNDDGIPDPGDRPVNLWIAAEVQKTGDLAYSKKLIEDEFVRNPGDMEVAKAIQELRKEEALNRVQKDRWNFANQYVKRPFSKFNVCMAVAFLAQERQLKGLFHQIGEKCLNAALEIDPKSPDALLLKGWYAYAGENAGEAVRAAREAISVDPENAKVWLGLGFFLLKAGSQHEAAAAFNKVIELYPGYSKRSMIIDICKQIQEGLPVDSLSENRNDSSSNEQLQNAPSS